MSHKTSSNVSHYEDPVLIISWCKAETRIFKRMYIYCVRIFMFTNTLLYYYIWFYCKMIHGRTCVHVVLGVVSEARSTLHFRTVEFVRQFTLSVKVLTCSFLYHHILCWQHRWGEVGREASCLCCLSSFTCAAYTYCISGLCICFYLYKLSSRICCSSCWLPTGNCSGHQLNTSHWSKYIA